MSVRKPAPKEITMNTRLAVLVGACLMLAGCAGGPRGGSQAPAFTAEDTGGKTVRLADFSDQVLILDFWAVW
jgi:hypothetical protein